jgi:hypothetical protein
MSDTGINIQIWNNNTPKTVTEFKNSNTIDYDDYCAVEIEKKNELMKKFGYGLDSPSFLTEIFSDTDKDFSCWTNEKIRSLIKSGIIYQEESDFHICGDCGNMIAEASVFLNSNCKMCGSNNIKTQKDIGLFIDIPDKKEPLFETRLYSPINDSLKKDLSNRFKLLPPRVFINKRRFTGIAIELEGFYEFVVDPKIAISLLPEYSAIKLGLNEIIQIQGVSTATNTIPYTSIMNSGDYANRYIFINKTPPDVLSKNKELDDKFYGFIIGNLLSKGKPMTMGEFLQAKTDYLAIKERLVNSMKWLNNDKATNFIYLSGDIITDIGELNDNLKNGKLNDAIKTVKRIVNTHIVHDYACRCYKNNARLPTDDIRALTIILEPIFGKII